MIRKLVFPAIAAALLAGCVTDYAYRGGDRGDYYYGQPSVEYRYEGGYGGYGGYAPYGYGGHGYGAGLYGYPYRNYGLPYGHGGYYNRPYYPPYYRPYHPRPRVTHPHPDGSPPPPQHRRDDRPPPWRNFDDLRRRQSADRGPAAVPPREVAPARPAVEPRERGSRMEQTIRRANRNAEPRPGEVER